MLQCPDDAGQQAIPGSRWIGDRYARRPGPHRLACRSQHQPLGTHGQRHHLDSLIQEMAGCARRIMRRVDHLTGEFLRFSNVWLDKRRLSNAAQPQWLTARVQKGLGATRLQQVDYLSIETNR